MSHTSGPWAQTATFPPGDFVIYSKTAKGRSDSECKRIAYVYTENEDDARLIASAPDVLAAGKELAAAACDVHPTAPSSASITRLHAAIDAFGKIEAALSTGIGKGD